VRKEDITPKGATIGERDKKMKYVEKWFVLSDSNPDKKYTVSRVDDGSFACSCPAWTFGRKRCKHIRYVVEHLIGVIPAEQEVVDKFRFIAKINGIILSCDNCVGGWMSSGGSCPSGPFGDRILYSTETKPFYILGRCCRDYERRKY
jgi:hypothetical protein